MKAEKKFCKWFWSKFKVLAILEEGLETWAEEVLSPNTLGSIALFLSPENLNGL
jgi:hypothetical protein